MASNGIILILSFVKIGQMVQKLKENTHAHTLEAARLSKPWLKMWVSTPRTSLCLTSVQITSHSRTFLGTYGKYKPRDVLAIASMHRSAMSGVFISLYMGEVLCNFNHPITGQLLEIFNLAVWCTSIRR
jgi:hypothetical protein